MIKQIINPVNGKKVSISSNSGIKVLRNYIKMFMIGGDDGCALTSKNRCAKSGTRNPELCELNSVSGRCRKKTATQSKPPQKRRQEPAAQERQEIISKGYIERDASLTEKQRRFCRCVLHVAKNNTKECNRNRSWGKKTKCYNPYAVCAKTIGTTTGRKPCFYMFENPSIPAEEIIAYAHLNYDTYETWARKQGKKSISDMNNKELRQNINEWYNSYKSKKSKK